MSAHKIWRFGADIDTDALAPGAYMKLGIDGIAPHCLEVLRPEFATAVRHGDVLVAGASFGIGSSREQAAAALVHLGVRAVIAPSYSGLFFRNAFNLGLLLLTCARAEELQDGDMLELELPTLTIRSASGAQLACDPIPDFLLNMVAAGGLLNQLRKKLGRSRLTTGPDAESSTPTPGNNPPPTGSPKKARS